MHRLAKLEHQVVCQIGEQIDRAHAAVEEADAHVDRADFLCDVAHLEAGVAEAQLAVDDVDADRRKVLVRREVHAADGVQRAARQGGEFARDAVVAPQVGAVCQGLVVYLKNDVADRIRLGDRRAERQIIRDLPQAAVVGADAELLFGAAHAVRFDPRDLGTDDVHAAGLAAFAGKCDGHALAHVRCTADAVVDLVAGVYFQQVQLFRIRMVFNGEDARGDDVLDVAAHIVDVLDLGGGKRELVDQLFKIEAGKINEVVDPVH